MVSSINNLMGALASTPRSSGGIDFTTLFGGGSAGSMYSPANVTVALKQAEQNEAKQLAQVSKEPIIQRELARYEKVVKSAKTIDDVLSDPIARKVLLTANGLGAYADQVGLVKKALASNPADPNSVAAKLSSTNGGWLTMVQKYDFATNGLDLLRPNTSGFTGDWTLTIRRDGKPYETDLKVSYSTKTGWTAKADGGIAPITVTGDTIAVSWIWEDEAGKLHSTKITGKLGKDGNLSGSQLEEGFPVSGFTWGATPASGGAIQDVSDGYLAEKRLDMLDAQLPGLGTAILFKTLAPQLDNRLKILGSALGREVVTTALGLPKQLAFQSLEAQQKAIRSVDPAKFKDPVYVDRLVQRYLTQLNGGSSGVTA